MKLSATSIIVTFATLSGVLAQTPDTPPADQPANPEKTNRVYATKCEVLSPYGEGWHVRCDYDASEDEAKASGAKWKVLMTEL
ncbi:hypothetical protein LLEC1_04298 [Akanthomyces lecanii]|uniref:Uncharacterized protein n=1 Tax=Cordyceps confragosa TaxID=2714763 RepID=A0A179I274_CORDF|nr:hypothetical protein LLEC1_04298 [Akanthomyces lecanii]